MVFPVVTPEQRNMTMVQYKSSAGNCKTWGIQVPPQNQSWPISVCADLYNACGLIMWISVVLMIPRAYSDMTDIHRRVGPLASSHTCTWTSLATYSTMNLSHTRTGLGRSGDYDCAPVRDAVWSSGCAKTRQSNGWRRQTICIHSSHTNRAQINIIVNKMLALTTWASSRGSGKELPTLLGNGSRNAVPCNTHNLLRRNKVILLSRIQKLTVPSLNRGQFLPLPEPV